MSNERFRVLVLGGYGMFGRRLATNLARHYDLDVTIAGRNLDRAHELQREIATRWDRRIAVECIDLDRDNLALALLKLTPDVVVNASGPYQGLDYRVAQACIDAGVHYLDLADDREFVANISTLHEQAVDKGLLIAAGASSVPALSSAVVDHYRSEFYELESICLGISPGNRIRRGIGTVSSVLSCVGQPFTTLIDGRERTLHGWQKPHRFDFGPPLGKRWMSDWNGPDLGVFPETYREVRSLRFRAGLELPLLHLGLYALSGLTRAGVVKNWAPYAKPLKAISEWFFRFGSDGGRHVRDAVRAGPRRSPADDYLGTDRRRRHGPGRSDRCRRATGRKAAGGHGSAPRRNAVHGVVPAAGVHADRRPLGNLPTGAPKS